jgi:acyl-CoA synthetase (AMP-forming)/AMP-acid ligase II
LLSLVHVLEWRAAVQPGAIALSDQQDADLASPAAADRPPPRPVDRLRPSEPAILVHTSGTTGRPKLVPLTHQQLITAVVFMKLEVPEAVPGARHLSALPLFHVAGLANLRSLTADGFYRTGDVGTLDADGYLTIVDRLSDLVITGGENVYPAEVEAVLAGHPAVADVAVIGIPDEWWGETVHAIVVLAPGNTARANGDAEPGFDAGALVSWARERLAGFKCPTGVTVAPELPRNATGTVLRAQLRAPFWAGRDRQVS